MENTQTVVKVGDIFIAHDYYNDITNWYRVTKRRGKLTVDLERLEKHATSGGGYVHSGTCMPDLDKPGHPLSGSRRLSPNNIIRIDQYVSAHLWKGEEGTYDYDRD